jgi:hypothetical protein
LSRHGHPLRVEALAQQLDLLDRQEGNTAGEG